MEQTFTNLHHIASHAVVIVCIAMVPTITVANPPYQRAGIYHHSATTCVLSSSSCAVLSSWRRTKCRFSYNCAAGQKSVMTECCCLMECQRHSLFTHNMFDFIFRLKVCEAHRCLLCALLFVDFPFHIWTFSVSG